MPTEQGVCNDTPVGKRKKKTRAEDLLDELIKEYGGSERVTGPGGLLKDLESRGEVPDGQSNRRNGKNSKTVRTDQELDIEVPRDRDGSFDPKIVPKHKRHFDGFDDKILSMYARGMSVREIRAHREEICGVEVSPDLISHVTGAVVEELEVWRSRPLERVYLVAYLDALVIKVRDKSGVQNKAVCGSTSIPTTMVSKTSGITAGRSSIAHKATSTETESATVVTMTSTATGSRTTWTTARATTTRRRWHRGRLCFGSVRDRWRPCDLVSLGSSRNPGHLLDLRQVTLTIEQVLVENGVERVVGVPVTLEPGFGSTRVLTHYRASGLPAEFYAQVHRRWLRRDYAVALEILPADVEQPSACSHVAGSFTATTVLPSTTA